MTKSGKLSLLISLLVMLVLGAAGAAEQKVDFARDVQPIFKAACYQCHGPDKQKGKLRLDAKTIALHGGKSGKSIVPGNAQQSELIKRITSKDDDERMAQDREGLAGEQMSTIKSSIEQGGSRPD